MRLILFLIILLLIDLYAFQAFRAVVPGNKQWKVLLYGMYTSVSIVAFLYILGGSQDWFEGWSKNTHIYFRAFVFILFFSKLFVALMMGIDDVRRFIALIINYFSTSSTYDIGRSRFLSRVGIMLGVIPFVSLTYGILRNPYRYRLHRHTVRLKGLPALLDGLRIVQISDIHAGSFTFKNPIKNGIELINEQEPDIVFFTGDLVNSISSEMEPYIDIFQEIRSKYGIFSILGNHDYGDYHRWDSEEAKKENFRLLETIHRKLGWHLMKNESHVLEINGAKLAIIGVENYSTLPHFKKYGDLELAVNGVEEVPFKVLLSHDPTHWSAQVTQDFKEIGLTLSGHTHGFQFGIEIPGWIKWSPGKYIYKHWAGLYQEDEQYLYVNRGFGVLGYPGRVGILPEITLLELKSAS